MVTNSDAADFLQLSFTPIEAIGSGVHHTSPSVASQVHSVREVRAVIANPLEVSYSSQSVMQSLLSLEEIILQTELSMENNNNIPSQNTDKSKGTNGAKSRSKAKSVQFVTSDNHLERHEPTKKKTSLSTKEQMKNNTNPAGKNRKRKADDGSADMALVALSGDNIYSLKYIYIYIYILKYSILI